MRIETARLILSLAVLSVVPVLGCKDSGTTPFINDQFQADDAPRSVDLIMAQQNANAAREDGTLYGQHFTNGKLNSLGYAKLSKMTYGEADTGKFAVYIDLKGDAFTAARDNVSQTLVAAGYAEDTFTITSGFNPNVGASAEKGLKALDKQGGGAAKDITDSQMEAYGKGVGSNLKKD